MIIDKYWKLSIQSISSYSVVLVFVGKRKGAKVDMHRAYLRRKQIKDFQQVLYSEYRKSAVNNFIVDKILAFLQAFFL
ncbi:hypothetical protein EGI16_16100 [Chryseobacterium sp. G0240]|nr:hypothetical protein EGI16_16100 [Chryseobacterium sp. G0240]